MNNEIVSIQTLYEFIASVTFRLNLVSESKGKGLEVLM